MSKEKASKVVYFPGLNGVRILACYLIIAFHVNQLKGIYGLERLELHLLGPSSMYLTLFFVLSSFLITYLLLAEKELTNKINLKKFYTRRVLRVWPLYFLVIILGFGILPHFTPFQFPENNMLEYGYYWEMLLAFIFLFPHLHGIVFDVNTTISPLWSIGVEEQFYFIWPFVITYFKKPVLVLCSIVVLFLGLRHIDHIVGLTGIENSDLMTRLQWVGAYFNRFRLGTMAVGGLIAFVYFRKLVKIQRILYHPLTQWAAWLSLLCFQIFPAIRPTLLEHEVYALVSAIMVINLATNPKTLVSLENKWLKYLGELTYSSYVFHIPCIMLCIYVFHGQLGINLDSVWGNVLLFGSSMLMTLCISYFSYTYFESFFIRLKHRFAVVKNKTH